jgi:hypothetical protein
MYKLKKINDMENIGLTTKELKQVSEIMTNLEEETYLPNKNNSGGFAKCKFLDYDNEIINISLMYGTFDEESNIQTEQFAIDREEMKIID